MRIVSLHLIQGIIEDYNLSVICLAIELAQRKCSEEVGDRPLHIRILTVGKYMHEKLVLVAH